MKYKNIETLIKNFYDIAKKDILIGHHFRVIDNFDEHIPRIANFWYLQLTGNLIDRSHLPFELIKKHKALLINKGEVNRWMVIFQKLLQESKEFEQAEKEVWLEKANHFKEKIMDSLF